MDDKLIYGIQQIGIGVENANQAFEWYATRLGSDILIFDDENEATFMAPYTGGMPHKRRALLTMNLQGGSGFEIWQYLDRKPTKSKTELCIGDLGINFAKIKTREINKCFEQLKKQQVEILSGIECMPDNTKCFYIKDPFGNILQIIESSSWYSDNKKSTGGICGCMIGVSNIDSALKLYSGILEYTTIIYDRTTVFEDLYGLPNGKRKFRRVLLAHENNRTGGFSKLFGESQIELIQSLESTQKHIYENRYWGDLGFIHLCFDIRNMNALVKECSLKDFPFKILSDDSFNMGQANGYWGYIEDNDGTLIEFVETNKVPLIKKLNWNINLKKRDPNKPLPNWLIKAMSINRVKFRKNSN